MTGKVVSAATGLARKDGSAGKLRPSGAEEKKGKTTKAGENGKTGADVDGEGTKVTSTVDGREADGGKDTDEMTGASSGGKRMKDSPANGRTLQGAEKNGKQTEAVVLDGEPEKDAEKAVGQSEETESLDSAPTMGKNGARTTRKVSETEGPSPEDTKTGEHVDQSVDDGKSEEQTTDERTADERTDGDGGTGQTAVLEQDCGHSAAFGGMETDKHGPSNSGTGHEIKAAPSKPATRSPTERTPEPGGRPSGEEDGRRSTARRKRPAAEAAEEKTGAAALKRRAVVGRGQSQRGASRQPATTTQP